MLKFDFSSTVSWYIQKILLHLPNADKIEQSK